MPSIAPKIPKFCVTLDWSILHNFLDCAYFKFPKNEVKNHGMIQYLNIL
jgi:hypothetical protein